MATIDLSLLPAPFVVEELDYETLLSALYAALHVEGVQRVVINAPLADVVLDKTQAAWCTGSTITVGGTDD